MSSKYNEEFYSSRHNKTSYSAKVITSIVQEYIHASSAVDLGCGVGTWLKVLEDNGMRDVFGIEGEWIREDTLLIPETKFLKTNLGKPLKLDRQFDLAISLEVAEHIHEVYADQFLDNLTALAPVILFSAAIPKQGGTHHVNEQWPEYWRDKFSKRNFVLLDCIRPKVWNDPLIRMWYAQNSFVFVRRDKLASFPQLIPYAEKDNPMLALVHPRFYEYQLETWPILKSIRSKVKRMIGPKKQYLF